MPEPQPRPQGSLRALGCGVRAEVVSAKDRNHGPSIDHQFK